MMGDAGHLMSCPFSTSILENMPHRPFIRKMVRIGYRLSSKRRPGRLRAFQFGSTPPENGNSTTHFIAALAMRAGGNRLGYPFCAYPLHQPAPATDLPVNRGQAAVFADALPW
jgi:hypothetical protein